MLRESHELFRCGALAKNLRTVFDSRACCWFGVRLRPQRFCPSEATRERSSTVIRSTKPLDVLRG
jgi:hypothetical protein